MLRQEMIEILKSFPGPITDAIVVFDDFCEFCILTQNAGYECLVLGFFPILGPIKIPTAIYNDLQQHFDEENLIDEILHNHEPETLNRKTLLSIIELIGEDALNSIIANDWGPEKEFYVYHNYGVSESAFFATLQDAYNYFLNIFTNGEDGTSWDDMTNDELVKWCAIVDNWRSSGAMLLPVGSLGAYYSNFIGRGRAMELIEEEYDRHE